MAQGREGKGLSYNYLIGENTTGTLSLDTLAVL